VVTGATDGIGKEYARQVSNSNENGGAGKRVQKHAINISSTTVSG